MLKKISLVVCVTAALAFACLSTASAGDPNQAAMTYKIYCARCHGETGHGNGPDGASLSTKPRDFADCQVMSKISDDTIFKAIKGGGASVGLPPDMPAWGMGLSDDQIHHLVTYVRHFCKK